MGKKLYVGNLSYSVDSQCLTDVFNQCGQVETAKVISDRDSGRSKGFAFVEMSSSSEASLAIERLNGKDLEGRAMNVSEAKPMAPREDGGFGRGGFSSRSRH